MVGPEYVVVVVPVPVPRPLLYDDSSSDDDVELYGCVFLAIVSALVVCVYLELCACGPVLYVGLEVRDGRARLVADGDFADGG